VVFLFEKKRKKKKEKEKEQNEKGIACVTLGNFVLPVENYFLFFQVSFSFTTAYAIRDGHWILQKKNNCIFRLCHVEL
jgi:hypothetical protein